MRRFIAFFLIILTISACPASIAKDNIIYSSYIVSDAQTISDDGSDPVVTYDASEYEDGRVLIVYDDETTEVREYDDDQALLAALDELSAMEDVSIVQPDYTYTRTSLSTNDTYISSQWALYNDGTFYMEENNNRFPVYDSPFSTPSAPGEWTPPSFSHRQVMYSVSGLSYSIDNDIGDDFYSANRNFIYTANSSTPDMAVSGIDINLEEAWNSYNGGVREVIIALIDTGVDYSHEDLSDIIWVNTDEIPDNGIDDDGNGYIDDVYGWNFYDDNASVYVSSSDDSHGTHGAGTMAARANNGVGIAGILQSDNIKIMVLKALGGSNGAGSTSSIINAIKYAEANGASICNLSLGGSINDSALAQVIGNSSMLFVVASGNDGDDIDSYPSYPASYAFNNIIAVANLSYDGNLHYSSNYGASSVDIAAPGTHILSCTPDNGYSYMTGTSMAAPFVTAAAAMIYSHYDGITLSDVKDIILNSATALDSLSGMVATGGMLNLGAALNYDVSTLSHSAWDNSAVLSLGSAPEIRITSSLNVDGTVSLAVAFTDADNDLEVLSYASGHLSAADFAQGAGESNFEVSSNGVMTFTVFGSGVYTFYARDKAGNETVRSISVAHGKAVM